MRGALEGIHQSLLLAAAMGLCASPDIAVAAASQPHTQSEGEQSAADPILFTNELARARTFVDEMMAEGLVVPRPNHAPRVKALGK